MNMSLSKYKTDEFEESFNFASQAIEMDPKNVKALYRRSLIYLKHDNFKKA